MDTLGTARAWAQHVERCCANALDFIEQHTDDRKAKEMLSEKFDQFDSTPLHTSQRPGVFLNVLNMLRACAGRGQIQCICTMLREIDHFQLFRGTQPLFPFSNRILRSLVIDHGYLECVISKH